MKYPFRPMILGVALLIGLGAAAAGDADFNGAKKDLEAAIQTRNEAAAKSAIARVAADQSERAAKLLAQAAPAGQELDIYKELVDAIGSFSSDGAVKEATRILEKDSDWVVRFVFAEGVSKIEKPEARKALFSAFDDKHEQVATNAMRAAKARRLKEAVKPLIDAMEAHEKKQKGGRMHIEARRALIGITAQQFTEAGDFRRWWEQAEATFDAAKAAEAAKEEEAKTVLRRVEDRGDYAFVEQLSKADIHVVGGHSDQCENVLEVLKLPFTFHAREKASEMLKTIQPRSLIVFNCEGDEAKKLKGQDAKNLAAFVEKGGYLFTSDWGIMEVVNAAIGGYIGQGPEMPDTAFDVKITPTKGMEKHPYLRDVFPEDPFARGKMKWTVDNRAFGIRTTPKSASLVESPQLAQKGAPCVAATFRHGRGSVLHVMGHFKMQKDASGDGFALQQLLVNFIVEKQKMKKGKAPEKEKGKE